MKGMVVAPQPYAAEEGAKILERGGNAIDAAIATAFVQGIVDPQMCGVGGWGTMVIYVARTKELKCLDFFGRAGSKVTPGMWEKDVYGEAPLYGTFLIKGSPHILGYTSIMIPGTVKGLYEASEKYGTLKWKELIQPAIRYAREGFYIGRMAAETWHKPEVKEAGLPSGPTAMTASAEARRIYLKEDENFYEVGELFKNEHYARTLEKIAEEGADSFYRGELAKIIADDIEKNGGFVTADDLRSYQVKTGDPVLGTYRGYKIASGRPPGSGVTTIEILNILEGYDLGRLQFNSAEHLYILAKAMQAAHADRRQWLADPEFYEVPVGRMISKERAAEWRTKINSGQEIKVFHYEPESTDTTHVSTADEEGNAASLTHTNCAVSGVITPGLGFMYNDSMAWVNPLPGHANSIEAGKARTSGVSPTIVLKAGKPFFVIGAPGAHSIISAVVQSIVNVIDYGMSAQEAVFAPRIHCEGDSVIIPARTSSAVCNELRRKGLNVKHSVFSWGVTPFALAHGIRMDPTAGIFEGGADPGGEGGVAFSVK